jgi:hypothetical protein
LGYNETESCKLCGDTSPIKRSHIVPKFVIKYLKDTGVTGYVRQGVNLNVRKQDFPRTKLLCAKCEEFFSKREKYFAETIFKPYLNDGIIRFEYQEWLRYFAVSVFWRFAAVEINDFEVKNPSKGVLIREAMSKWTSFLLEQTNNPGDFQYDMFFLDISHIADLNRHVPGMNWLLMRGFDGTIFFNKNGVGIYFRIPGFLFCCHIKPNKNNGWKKTSIKRKGVISTPQHVKDKRFGSFLLDRLKIAREMMDTMSTNQKGKIRDSYMKKFSDKHDKILELIQADADYFIRKD